MPEQRNFIKENFGTVNITQNPSQTTESTENGNGAKQTICLSQELKDWMTDIGNAVSEATGDSKYGASSVGREAVEFLKDFYSVSKKAKKYKAAIFALLEKLP